MALTTKGLPYPLPTALVSAGANDIKALAEAVDLKSLRGFTAYRLAAVASPNAPGAPLAFDTIERDDFAAMGGGVSPDKTYVVLPSLGAYLLTGNLRWSAATGSGDVGGYLERLNAAGGSIQVQARAQGPMNGGVSLAALVLAGGERIQLGHHALSTGMGHNVVFGHLGIWRLGD